MTECVEPPLRYSIDRLVVRGRRLFGWGWAAHRQGPIAGVTLQALGDGWQQALTADFGLLREDVAAAFPNLPGSASAGFVVTGFLPDSAFRILRLRIELHHGAPLDLDVTATADVQPMAVPATGGAGTSAASTWWRRLTGAVRGGAAVATGRRPGGAASEAEQECLDRLIGRLRQGPPPFLVIDHDLGGGANHYRRRLVAGRLAAGQPVALCTYDLPTLTFRLHLYPPGQGQEAADDGCPMPSLASLDRVVGNATDVFVNSPVSLDGPMELAQWLVRARDRNPAPRLTLTVHDYFVVCPSFFLLGPDGRYCDVPAVTECERCLAHNTGRQVSFSPPVPIRQWRAHWGRCLRAADEVRCFSASSREILRQVYPGLDPSRVSVVPHQVDFAPPRLPRLAPRGPLVVGVLGSISAPKGARVVGELLRRIEQDGADVRVVVVGTLEIPAVSPLLTVTGAYRHEDLVELIETHGINLFLFPSVCPETFSYTVAELMALRVPVLAFDLGAPAERLRSYDLGRLVPRVDAALLLAELRDFHRQLAGFGG